MKTPVLLALLLSLNLCFAAKPVDDNMVGLQTRNGRIAYDFINLWFNEKKGEEAWDKYVSKDRYMNHAVYSATRTNRKSFEEEKQEEARIGASPGVTFNIKQLVAQGSLVFAHIDVQKGPTRNPSELVMILRIRDGKITDHWDLHSEMKADSVVFDELVR